VLNTPIAGWEQRTLQMSLAWSVEITRGPPWSLWISSVNPQGLHETCQSQKGKHLKLASEASPNLQDGCASHWADAVTFSWWCCNKIMILQYYTDIEKTFFHTGTS